MEFPYTFYKERFDEVDRLLLIRESGGGGSIKFYISRAKRGSSQAPSPLPKKSELIYTMDQ